MFYLHFLFSSSRMGVKLYGNQYETSTIVIVKPIRSVMHTLNPKNGLRKTRW